MSEPNLFEQEQKVIEAAQTLLRDPEATKDAASYGQLLHQYTKLFKQFNRIVKINDLQQKALKNSEAKLLTEIEKRKEIEARLRENEIQLVAAKDIAEQALEDKARFFASMSHEIRTPLNGVLGSAQLLQTTSLLPKQQEYIETILSCGRILMVVINDILDLSKIESGKLELEHTPFDLEELMEKAVDLLSISAAEKGLELIFQSPTLEKQLYGDPTRLIQVLVNLVNNSIKFTSTGTIKITAEVVPGKQGGKELLFCVQDTGIGIPKEKQNHLFHAFSQVDVSTTRKYGGTGLGLSICQKLTELWNGAIWVESEEGQGSSFYFTLPLQISDEAVRANPSFEALGGKKIVIALGHKLAQGKVHRYAQMAGMEAQRANTPQEAAQAMQSRPDLLLIDWEHPNAPGWDFVTACKKTGYLPPTLLLGRKGTVLSPGQLNQFRGGMLHKPIKRLSFFQALTQLIQGLNLIEVDGRSQAVTYEKVAQILPLSILLVEDNLVNQRITQGALEVLGYQIDIAENGQIAIEKCKEREYQLLFMDMQMPVMGGLEATREIRKLFGEETPVILAMTANASAEDITACERAGMQGHLAKPISIEQVIHALHRYAPAGVVLKGMEAEESKEKEEALDDTLFDPCLMRSIKQNYPTNLLADLTEFYTQELDDTLSEMQSTLGSQDYSRVQHLAHKLKGASMNMGIRQIAQLFEQIEKDAHQQTLTHLAQQLDQLQQIKAPTLEGLRHYIL